MKLQECCHRRGGNTISETFFCGIWSLCSESSLLPFLCLALLSLARSCMIFPACSRLYHQLPKEQMEQGILSGADQLGWLPHSSHPRGRALGRASGNRPDDTTSSDFNTCIERLPGLHQSDKWRTQLTHLTAAIRNKMQQWLEWGERRCQQRR